MYSSAFIRVYEETRVIGVRNIFCVDRIFCVHTECREVGDRSVCLDCFTTLVYYEVFINLLYSC